MKKNLFRKVALTAIAALIILPIVTMAADEKNTKKDPVEPIEEAALLSKHETKAVFKGLEYRKCMGLTTMCPKECGHSGEFATFGITAYNKYEKPGEYGDAKQKTFLIHVSDFDKKALTKDSDGSDTAVLHKLIKTLKVGDAVTLNWNHNYVTTTYPDGTSSKSPRRVVQKLEKTEAKP